MRSDPMDLAALGLRILVYANERPIGAFRNTFDARSFVADRAPDYPDAHYTMRNVVEGGDAVDITPSRRTHDGG